MFLLVERKHQLVGQMIASRSLRKNQVLWNTVRAVGKKRHSFEFCKRLIRYYKTSIIIGRLFKKSNSVNRI